jgi:hypothetical protein
LAALATADQLLTVADEAVAMADGLAADVDSRQGGIQADPALLTAEHQAALTGAIQSLAEPVTRLNNTVLVVHEAATGLNDTLEALSQVRIVNAPPPPPELAAIGEATGAIAEQLDALATAASAATVDGARVNAAIDGLQGRISDMRGRLAGQQASVDAAQQAVAFLLAEGPDLLTRAIVILTLLLILFAAGQVSLFAHAWGWLKR